MFLFKKQRNSFKHVFCISLVESIKRREHIKKEMDKNGIANYEFIDAINQRDDIVEKAYSNNIVKVFPSCFRCGKNKCKCENNVLIPTQVATFFSHMKVWEIIANQPEGMYLIIEDDIKFNLYYKLIKRNIYKSLDNLSAINKTKPLLIRLAWAYNSEHKIRRFKFIKSMVRMSNPMYSINPSMARNLLDQFKTISTTVDIYVHAIIGTKCANYTLVPPLAHELSYSHGMVESLVRPRKKRIEVLKKINNFNAKEELNQYKNNIDKAILRKLLFVGHPKTGSDYVNEFLNINNIDVGYEKMGKDGILSWMFSVYDLHNPFYSNKYAMSRYFSSFESIIMFTMDPMTAIPVIIEENISSSDSLKFRAKHILKNYDIDINSIENDFLKAIEVYYLWSKLVIEKNKPDLIIRIEMDEDLLLKFLKEKKFHRLKSLKNHKKYTSKLKLNSDDLLALDQTWKRKINKLCLLLNYEQIFDDSLSLIVR